MNKKFDIDTIVEKRKSENDENSVKKVTHRILRMDGNGLNLSVAFLICLLLIVTPFIVSMLPVYLFSFEGEDGELMTYGLFSLISFVIMVGGWVFISLPCIGGYMFLAGETTEGKEHTLAGLFSVYFNYKRYFRAMLYGLLWVACAVVMILPIIGAFMQLVIYSESVIIISPVAWIPLIAFWLFTFAAVVCILLYLISCVFFVPYLYLNGMKLKNAFYVSVAISREHRWNIIKQLMGYFLRVLLGILSIGVLLVINAAPKISVSYFVYSNSVFFPVKTED